LDARKQYELVTKEWARKCEDEIRSWSKYENFALAQLKMDWSFRRTASRGGWYESAGGPGISMAMLEPFKPVFAPIAVSYEYASFHKDSVIGGFYYTPKTQFYYRGIMIVIHEMAHAAQFYGDRVLYQTIDAPHGNSFKFPYAKLRKSLFNHMLSDQSYLAANYAKMCKIINTKNEYLEWERGLQIS
jgi:hypothetical protein